MEETSELVSVADPVTRTTVDDYLKLQGLASQLTPEEGDAFASVAMRFQLNPLLREIHLVKSADGSKGRFFVVVGYESYLRRAEKTGKLDGWKTWTSGEGENLKAFLEIYRHDWGHPFVHEVHWSEAVQLSDDGNPTPFWNRMPKFQLRKVCIAQGFRLCFPEELGGIPYEPAELSLDARVNQSVQPVKTPVVASAPRTAFRELDDYLTANTQAFTAKHYRWIKEQLESTPTIEKAKAMLGYARKVVLHGGDSAGKATKPARTELVPEPAF